MLMYNIAKYKLLYFGIAPVADNKDIYYPAKYGNMCSLADVTVCTRTNHHCDLWEPFSMLNATIIYLTLILAKWL